MAHIPEGVLKVLGTYWNVEVVAYPLVENREEAWALVSNEDYTIKISNKGNLLTHLIHELVHVFCYALGNIPMTEEAVESLAQVLSAFFVDNPTFIKKIIHEIEKESSRISNESNPKGNKG